MPITATYLPAKLRLLVSGDADGNTITASRNAAGTLFVNDGVQVQGGPATVANTVSIQIDGNEGADIISLLETNGPLPNARLHGGPGGDRLTGGSGDDNLSGGDGDDQVFGEGGNDLVIWHAGDDSDLIEGGAGTDTVEINGGIGADTFSVSANGARVNVDHGVLLGVPRLDIGTTENIVINTGDGVDDVGVFDGLSGVATLTIDLGAGGDELFAFTETAAITALGQQGEDDLIGGAANDLLSGGADNDSLKGSGGDDTLEGGPGNDTIDGGDGNDRFVWNPGDGSDVIAGGTGFDTLDFNASGASDPIEIFNGGGHAWVSFSGNVLSLELSAVERIRVHSPGANGVIVNDLSGTDVTHVAIDLAGTPDGSTGDGETDEVAVDGTDGADNIGVAVSGATITINGLPAQVTIDRAEAIDQLFINGLGGNDRIDASALTAGSPELTIRGGAGEDTLIGGVRGDTLSGGLDDDRLSGGGGNDRLIWNADEGGDDVMDGGDGIDTIEINGGDTDAFIITANGGRMRVVWQDPVPAATLDIGTTENIVINASAGPDIVYIGNSLTGLASLTVNAGNSEDSVDASAATTPVTLLGEEGEDLLIGGAAGDLLIGGARGDGLLGGGGIDTASYATSSAGVTIDLANGTASGGDAAGDTLTEIENLIGSAHQDVLYGNALANVLIGGPGNDNLYGFGGDDTFDGGLGSDVMIGNAGTDTAVFTGNRSNYLINLVVGDGFAVVDQRPGQPFGADGLLSVENLVFADGVYAPVAPIDEVVWRHREGTLAIGDHNLGRVATTWQVHGTGDFDHDGDADLLWRHDDGQVVIWEMQDGAYVTNHNLPSASTSFQIAGTGDFDRDGDADILWRGGAGEVVTWEMENGAFVVNHNLPQASTSFQIAGTGDFDHDGDADILWRGGGGEVVTWEMENGSLVTNHNFPQVPTNFRIAGTGDFDHDGDADILWRNTGGDVVTWEMEDGNLAATHVLPQVSTTFRVAGTQDFDHDGDSDILWLNDNGLVVTWEMEDGAFLVNHNFGGVDNSEWQIRGTGDFGIA